jgi:mannose-6-phosphate isomerase-like protein (cupin superfamily)
MEKVIKPWGWYENLQQDIGYKVKRLYLDPDQKISLQYHIHRDEHWIVVGGNGKLQLEDQIKDIKVGDYIFVLSSSKHRVTAGTEGITIVEVQLGSICEESDIIRIEDTYGRS